MLIVYFEPFGNADGFCVYILQTILISTVQYITCVCGWNPVKTINGVFCVHSTKKYCTILYVVHTLWKHRPGLFVYTQQKCTVQYCTCICCTHPVETQTGVIIVYILQECTVQYYTCECCTHPVETQTGVICVHSTRMDSTILYL